MDFQVGDRVVHWSYGPGEIIQMDEKELSGRKSLYYVVQIKDLTLWVPVDATDAASLRYPTPASDFDTLFQEHWERVVAVLCRLVEEKGRTGLIITIDNAHDLDWTSKEFLRAILRSEHLACPAGSAAPIGVQPR